MLVDESGTPPSAAPSVHARLWPSDRVALATFVALIAVAFPVTLLVLGTQRWFHLDEWDALAARRAGSLDDLLRPHHEHMSALPILTYRGLWSLFGLRSYLPYQAVVVGLHLTAVVLLRLVMRRSGVGAWIATVTAGALIFFGAGREDIIGAFQMGFVGSLVFGLVQLVLVDHNGAWNRRDWLGLLCGVAALLSSGIGVTMVVVVGLAALVRRGWRVAMAQTAPLAVLFLAWFVAEKPPAEAANPGGLGRVSIIVRVADFVVHGVQAGFSALGSFRPVGVLLALLLVGGLALGCREQGTIAFVRRNGVPLALLVGGVVSLAISGWGRWSFGADYAGQSRYVYLTVALVLPALGVAIEAFGQQWRLAVPLALGLLMVGVPGNLVAFRSDVEGQMFAAERQRMLGLPFSPLARRVPPSVRPDPSGAMDVTIGWLLEQREAGKLSDPGPIDASVSSEFPIRLGLHQSLLPVVPKGCTPVTGAVEVSPKPGDSIVLDGNLVDISLRDGESWSPPVRYGVAVTHLFVTRLPGLTFRIAPASADAPLRVCH